MSDRVIRINEMNDGVIRINDLDISVCLNIIKYLGLQISNLARVNHKFWYLTKIYLSNLPINILINVPIIERLRLMPNYLLSIYCQKFNIDSENFHVIISQLSGIKDRNNYLFRNSAYNGYSKIVEILLKLPLDLTRYDTNIYDNLPWEMLGDNFQRVIPIDMKVRPYDDNGYALRIAKSRNNHDIVKMISDLDK